jgi:hypothetical protein
MTDPAIAALHMAARRYCADRASHWSRVYADQRAQHGDFHGERYDEQRASYCGAMARQILSSLERWLPAEVATLEAARARMSADARAAEDRLLRPLARPGAEAAVEERRAFERFVRQSSEADWARAAPLPFRRILAKAEVEALNRSFCDRWGTWDAGAPDRDDVPPSLTLYTEVWRRLPLLPEVRRLLAERGVDRLIELHRDDDSFELEPAATEFDHGDEVYWFVRGGDWMLYGSHLPSITLGGTWLIEAVRRALPSIDEHTFRGWGGSTSKI